MEEQQVFDFGLRLRELRKRRNLSQKEVAEKLDMHLNTVQKYESNTLTPSADKLKELAIIYNCSTDYILGLSDRTNVYIDDCSELQQKLIIDMIKLIKEDTIGYEKTND